MTAKHYPMKDGKMVYLPSAVGHLDQHQDVVPFLSEVIGKLVAPDGTNKFYKQEVDLGRIIGKTSGVKTTSTDKIVYAQRVGRITMTRFVMDREEVDCSAVTVVLKRSNHKNNQFQLITAYIGHVAEREPGDPAIQNTVEAERCKEYWDHHALVWGSQTVVA